MKKLLIASLLLVLMTGCASNAPGAAGTGAATEATAPAVAAGSQAAAPGVAGTPEAAAPQLPRPNVTENGTVVADAKIVPIDSIDFNFGARGIVAEVLVREGDKVKKGAPLARLDTKELQLQIADAQATLSEAKAAREQLIAGATPEQVAKAQAEVNRARAQLQQISGEVTPQDVTAAEAQVKEARERLAQLVAGPKEQDVRAAQAGVAEAKAALDATRHELSSMKTQAQSDMERAANDLRNSQDRYSIIYWENRQNEKTRELSPEERYNEDGALRAVQNNEERLSQAKVRYEEIQKNEIAGIQVAESRMTVAQAKLDKLVAGANPDEVAGAQARIAAAEANLAKLRNDARAGRLAVGNADIAAAQAALAQVKADPRPADLASAEARVLRAEVALKQIELAIEQATLFSPIAGTVVRADVKAGDRITETETNQFTIADLSAWEIRTSDLSELSVVRIREGDTANVTFYALPGFELTGKVKEIKPVGSEKGRDTLYTVIITPDTWNASLRWNMTASVSIVPQTTNGGVAPVGNDQ